MKRIWVGEDELYPYYSAGEVPAGRSGLLVPEEKLAWVEKTMGGVRAGAGIPAGALLRAAAS